MLVVVNVIALLSSPALGELVFQSTAVVNPVATCVILHTRACGLAENDKRVDLAIRNELRVERKIVNGIEVPKRNRIAPRQTWSRTNPGLVGIHRSKPRLIVGEVEVLRENSQDPGLAGSPAIVGRGGGGGFVDIVIWRLAISTVSPAIVVFGRTKTHDAKPNSKSVGSRIKGAWDKLIQSKRIMLVSLPRRKDISR